MRQCGKQLQHEVCVECEQRFVCYCPIEARLQLKERKMLFLSRSLLTPCYPIAICTH